MIDFLNGIFHDIDDYTLTLLLLIGAIVIGPLIAGVVRAPAIAGLLAAGLAIGPNGFDLLPFKGDIVSTFGELGLLLLMFTAGLELDLPAIKERISSVLTFGVLTFAFPWVIGTLIALAFSFEIGASLLIGSLWASHTLVTYGIMRASGKAGTPAIGIVVGATALTDTLSLSVLACVVAANAGGSLPSVFLHVGLGLAAVGAFVAWPMRWSARWLWSRKHADRATRYMSLLFLMVSAGAIAQLVGSEPIIGAFFAGLALNTAVPNRSALMHSIEFSSQSIFIPAFLVSVGLVIRLDVLAQLATLKLAAGFIGSVIIGKLLAAIVAGRILKFSRYEVIAAFGLSVNQAAATLAAAFVAYDAGIISITVINATIATILVSLLIGVWVTDWAAARLPLAASGQRPGQHVIVEDSDATSSLKSGLALAHVLAQPDAGAVSVVEIVGSRSPVEVGAAAERAAAVEELCSELGIEAEVFVRAGVSNRAALENTVTSDDGTFVVRALEHVRPDMIEPASVPMALLDTLSESRWKRVVLMATYSAVTDDVRDELMWSASTAARIAGGFTLPLVMVTPTTDDGDILWGTPQDSWRTSMSAMRVNPERIDVSIDDPSGMTSAYEAGDLVVVGASCSALVAHARSNPAAAVITVVAPRPLESAPLYSEAVFIGSPQPERTMA